MRFFKYLIFLFTILTATLSHSGTKYTINANGFNGSASSKIEVCRLYYEALDINRSIYTSYVLRYGGCAFVDSLWGGYAYDALISESQEQVSCPVSGYPAVTSFDKGSPTPLTVCESQSDGTFCVYKAKSDDPFVNGGGTYLGHTSKPYVILYSVSSIPSPNCTPRTGGTCNTSDPYGGCYVPPDDHCTRFADGSIQCLDNTPPPNPTNACNGATYCKRPPEGCPQGYVSGTFNGELLCVQSSPSSPPNPDEGGGASEPTGNNSNTSTSTSTSTSSSSSGDGTGGGTNVNNTNVNNITNNTTVNIDVSGIINAVKNMKDTLNVSLSTLNDKVKTVSDTLTGTNQKLDTANTTLNSINQKNQVTNDKLQELINKPNGTSQGNFDGSGIIDSVNSFKEKFIEFFGTDRDTSDLEQIGQESNDPRSNGARDNATSAFQNLANVLTFSNSACVPDLEINNIPLFHSVVIPLSKWCDLLAMVKILLHLGVLLTALRMVTDTVRVI